MTESKWNQVGYVISSKYRRQIMRMLFDAPKTPSAMSKPNTDTPISHVSRALTQLREREMVDLLVEENIKKGRIYGLTDHGEEVWIEARKQHEA